MFTVVLTGGIASGKSLASAHFDSLGIDIVDTDLISRELVQPGQPALQQIVQRFGTGMLTDQGQLDRSALRARVFASPEEREALQAILHPLIHERAQQLVEKAQSPYVLVVVPLFVETGKRYACDRVLVVDVDEALQKARLGKRDKLNQTQIEATLSAQASRAERLAAADDVILNDGDQEHLQQQVEKLHQIYLRLSHTEQPH